MQRKTTASFKNGLARLLRKINTSRISKANANHKMSQKIDAMAKIKIKHNFASTKSSCSFFTFSFHENFEKQMKSPLKIL
jgi:hypothetical protein